MIVSCLIYVYIEYVLFWNQGYAFDPLCTSNYLTVKCTLLLIYCFKLLN